MSEKYISIIALGVSVLSLLLSAFLGFREYNEKVVIEVNSAEIVSVDLEGGDYIDFSADIIVANTSKPTVSLIKESAYIGWDEYEIQSSPELPLSLVQGFADKINVRFRYSLSKEQVSNLINGEELDKGLNHNHISIHLGSATNKTYYGVINLKDIRWSLKDWYKQ